VGFKVNDYLEMKIKTYVVHVYNKLKLPLLKKLNIFHTFELFGFEGTAVSSFFSPYEYLRWIEIRICEELVLLYFVAVMSFSEEKIPNQQLRWLVTVYRTRTLVCYSFRLQVYQSVMLK